jgi:hypothetical protein
MSAPAPAFYHQMSATDSVKRADSPDFGWHVRTVNMLMDALSNLDLYESNDELRPSGAAILAAADVLVHVEPEDRDIVEIEPYSGELSLIWRAGREKRVKAMFGQEKGPYSVYYERMVDGRVTEHHLEPNADHTYLKERLAWLHA